MVCLIQAQIRDILFCRVSGSLLLLLTRWDPDDALIVFVGRLKWREHMQRTVSD